MGRGSDTSTFFTSGVIAGYVGPEPHVGTQTCTETVPANSRSIAYAPAEPRGCSSACFSICGLIAAAAAALSPAGPPHAEEQARHARGESAASFVPWRWSRGARPRSSEGRRLLFRRAATALASRCGRAPAARGQPLTLYCASHQHAHDSNCAAPLRQPRPSRPAPLRPRTARTAGPARGRSPGYARRFEPRRLPYAGKYGRRFRAGQRSGCGRAMEPPPAVALLLLLPLLLVPLALLARRRRGRRKPPFRLLVVAGSGEWGPPPREPVAAQRPPGTTAPGVQRAASAPAVRAGAAAVHAGSCSRGGGRGRSGPRRAAHPGWI